jgi:hypothetical protein
MALIHFTYEHCLNVLWRRPEQLWALVLEPLHGIVCRWDDYEDVRIAVILQGKYIRE